MGRGPFFKLSLGINDFKHSVNHGQQTRESVFSLSMVINTTEGRQSMADSYSIRRNALQHKVCSTTTLAGGEAICMALKFGPEKTVRRLQDLHAGI